MPGRKAARLLVGLSAAIDHQRSPIRHRQEGRVSLPDIQKVDVKLAVSPRAAYRMYDQHQDARKTRGKDSHVSAREDFALLL